MSNLDTTVSPVFVLEVPVEVRYREAARNQLESGLTFDDLIEFWKAGCMPAFGTVHYRAMVEDAMATVRAKAYSEDPAFLRALVNEEDPKVLREAWNHLAYGVRRDDGPSLWDKTVFETIRCRKHLYEDEYTEAMFEVQYSDDIRFFAGLNDPRVMTAVAWLEGDDNVMPVNDRRDRHRDNGDWMLEFDSGKRTKRGDMMTYMVIVHAAAFEPFAIEDRDECCWERIELVRGSNPLNWPVVPDNIITESFINAIAAADEAETVVTYIEEDDMADEEISLL